MAGTEASPDAVGQDLVVKRKFHREVLRRCVNCGFEWVDWLGDERKQEPDSNLSLRAGEYCPTKCGYVGDCISGCGEDTPKGLLYVYCERPVEVAEVFLEIRTRFRIRTV